MNKLTSPIPDRRMSKQRRVLLEVLAGVETHPTADEVFRTVRRKLPHISLGTVYRNLEVLSEMGRIGRLDIPGGQRRFDPDTGAHYHIRCENCGKVRDVEVQPVRELEQLARNRTDFTVTGYRLEFTGECPECSTASTRTRQETEKARQKAEKAVPE